MMQQMPDHEDSVTKSDNHVWDLTTKVEGQKIRLVATIKEHVKSQRKPKEKLPDMQTQEQVELRQEVQNLYDLLASEKEQCAVEKLQKAQLEKELMCLQKDYDALKAVRHIAEDDFASKLDEEIKHSAMLQQDLNTIWVSHQEVCRQCQTLETEAQTLNQRLQAEILSHADKVQHDMQAIGSLRAKQKEIQQMMEEQLAAIEKDALVKEEALLDEVAKLKIQVEEMSCKPERSTQPRQEQDHDPESPEKVTSEGPGDERPAEQ